MIPISLYGINRDECERFYDELPGLVYGSFDEFNYSSNLFKIEQGNPHQQIEIAERWAGRENPTWPEEIEIEIEMTLRAVKYPDVGMLAHLMTIEGIDAQRISEWMHFSTNIYPIYSKKACETLTRLGVDTPYRPDDIASYGLYVTRIEGLKIFAPATGLPESGLPRARILQLGLERFE